MSTKDEKRVYPYIDGTGIHFQSEEWSNIPPHMETNTMPTMVEKVYNPTIAEILANPSLMVRYQEPVFDEGDDIQPVDDNWNSDPMQTGLDLNQGVSPGNLDGAPAPQAPRSKSRTKDETSDKETGEPEDSGLPGGSGGVPPVEG